MELNVVHNQDCIEGMKDLPDNSIDAIITDPPYELGFMSKAWDNTGIAYNVDMWKEALRVLKPGGHLLSFGGSRTYHRMACAIEDAGFEIRDQILWIYGSGFPKSLGVSKSIDKMYGAEREVIGYREHKDFSDEQFVKQGSMMQTHTKAQRTDVPITAPSTPQAKEWEGWGTALKPAHEPIVMARKPLAEKTVAENVLKWGVGGINIDASRVGDVGGTRKSGEPSYKPTNALMGGLDGSLNGGGCEQTGKGRYPANLIHDGSDMVTSRFPITQSGGGDKANIKPKSRTSQCPSAIDGGDWEVNESSASRFFKSCPQDEMNAPFYYCAKASKKERNKGCESLTDSEGIRTNAPRNNETDKTPLRKNTHPTVKPLSLIEYLIVLTTRQGATVLDPFMGSGTTAVACINKQRNYIGYEMDESYIQIINARIDEANKPL